LPRKPEGLVVLTQIQPVLFPVPEGSLTDQDKPFVPELCRRLDGIALALELAKQRRSLTTNHIPEQEHLMWTTLLYAKAMLKRSES
jgi:predicted ATPase